VFVASDYAINKGNETTKNDFEIIIMGRAKHLRQKKREGAAVKALTACVQKILLAFLLIKDQEPRVVRQFDLQHSLAFLRDIID
jgi:hypothetical protein